MAGDRLIVAGDAHYVGRRRLFDGRGDAAGPDWLMNATLSARPLWGPLDLSLRATNLFNRKIRDLVSTDHNPVTSVQQRPLTAWLRADVHY